MRPYIRRASSAYQRNWSIVSAHSRCACPIGLPVSLEIIRAASAARRIISSAIARSASARRNADVARHALSLASAACSAASVSAALATGASPSAASVTGLMTGAFAPFAAASHSPAM
jgi:hypothetical protein